MAFPKELAIYDIFYIVPQGHLNCQLSTVNCQLKHNLSDIQSVSGRGAQRMYVDLPASVTH